MASSGSAFFRRLGRWGSSGGSRPDSMPLPEHIQPSLAMLCGCSPSAWPVGLFPGGPGAVARSGRRPSSRRNLFQQAAVVTLGGAYSVLPYVAQQAVEYFHWLTPAQMIDGLGLAETLPGPLIKVLQFVGFLAAGTRQRPGPVGAPSWEPSPPLTSPLCRVFLWIFLGAPYIEQIRRNRTLNGSWAPSPPPWWRGPQSCRLFGHQRAFPG